jgi:integral membrane protein
MSPQSLFRRLAVAEAVTWALLLTGMVLKYVTRTTELGVEVFGMVHGVVFIGYCLVTVFVAVNQRWSATTTLLGLAAAIPPFATVWFDRRVERRDLLAGPWRLAPGGTDRPRGPLERTQAWMLRRPATAVVVAVAAVAVLTAAALVVGPPVPPQS